MNVHEQIKSKQKMEGEAVQRFKMSIEPIVSSAGGRRHRIVHELKNAIPVAEKILNALSSLEDLQGYLTGDQQLWRRWAEELLSLQNIPSQIDRGIRRYQGVTYGDIRDFNSKSQTESLILIDLKSSDGARLRIKHLAKTLARVLEDELEEQQQEQQEKAGYNE